MPLFQCCRSPGRAKALDAGETKLEAVAVVPEPPRIPGGVCKKWAKRNGDKDLAKICSPEGMVSPVRAWQEHYEPKKVKKAEKKKAKAAKKKEKKANRTEEEKVKDQRMQRKVLTILARKIAVLSVKQLMQVLSVTLDLINESVTNSNPEIGQMLNTLSGLTKSFRYGNCFCPFSQAKHAYIREEFLQQFLDQSGAVFNQMLEAQGEGLEQVVKAEDKLNQLVRTLTDQVAALLSEHQSKAKEMCQQAGSSLLNFNDIEQVISTKDGVDTDNGADAILSVQKTAMEEIAPLLQVIQTFVVSKMDEFADRVIQFLSELLKRVLIFLSNSQKAIGATDQAVQTAQGVTTQVKDQVVGALPVELRGMLEQEFKSCRSHIQVTVFSFFSSLFSLADTESNKALSSQDAVQSTGGGGPVALDDDLVV